MRPSRMAVKGMMRANVFRRLQMSKFPLFCIAWLVLTASSGLSQDIHYNFDDTADFSKFKTYKWVTLKSEAPIE